MKEEEEEEKKKSEAWQELTGDKKNKMPGPPPAFYFPAVPDPGWAIKLSGSGRCYRI